MSVSVFVGPMTHPKLVDAVVAAGAELSSAESADAIVWTDPFAIAELVGLLTERVRWVSLPVAGVDRVIQAGLIDGGRTWTATKGVYGDAVSEHAIALLLAFTRHLAAAARRTTWTPDPGWRLRGAKVAIVGVGGIGNALAVKLRAFGAVPVGISRAGGIHPDFDAVYPITDLVEALESARAAVLAVPYTEQTRGLIGAAHLNALGPDGVLVNVARGEIVQTDELVEALTSGQLGAAGLDVTDPEPLPDGHPLWGMPNVIISPHAANPFTSLPWDACIPEYAEHLHRNVRAFIACRELEGTIDAARGY